MTNKLTSNIDTSVDSYRPPLSDRFNEQRTTNIEHRTMNNQIEIASFLAMTNKRTSNNEYRTSNNEQRTSNL